MHQRTERGFASVAQLLSFFAVGSAAIMPPLAYVSATTVTSFRAPETLPQRGAASILAGNSLAENVMPFETPLSRDYATDAACSSRDERTDHRGYLRVAISWLIEEIVAGFSAYGAIMHPEVFWPPDESTAIHPPAPRDDGAPQDPSP
jgi:hypothetical protein